MRAPPARRRGAARPPRARRAASRTTHLAPLRAQRAARAERDVGGAAPQPAVHQVHILEAAGGGEGEGARGASCA